MRYTIAARIADTDGHASGFDYLRLGLALAIVCLHSAITSYGKIYDVAIFESWARPFVRMILPAFFALSGFLVAGSLMRTHSLITFLWYRAVRIYPALIVECLLSAFILGPVVTRYNLTDYFTDPLFAQYMLNITGHVHFLLPGVFNDNPLPDIVNGQLWTIPFELYCYITLALVALLGLKRHRILAPIFTVLVTVAYLAATMYRHNGEIVYVASAINGALLVATFLAGVGMYLYRDVLPWGRVPMLLSGALSMACLAYIPNGDFFAPIPVAYFTVCVGLTNPSRRVLAGADYSYGIFLYGFVIQQTLMFLLPSWRHWALNILLSVPAAFIIAAASWHLVEKPAQNLRGKIKPVEEAWLRWRASKALPAALAVSKEPQLVTTKETE